MFMKNVLILIKVLPVNSEALVDLKNIERPAHTLIFETVQEAESGLSRLDNLLHVIEDLQFLGTTHLCS